MNSIGEEEKKVGRSYRFCEAIKVYKSARKETKEDGKRYCMLSRNVLVSMTN